MYEKLEMARAHRPIKANPVCTRRDLAEYQKNGWPVVFEYHRVFLDTLHRSPAQKNWWAGAVEYFMQAAGITLSERFENKSYIQTYSYKPVGVARGVNLKRRLQRGSILTY